MLLLFILMYQSNPRTPIPPSPNPPGEPREICLFRKKLVKFPTMLPVLRSNAPPFWASEHQIPRAQVIDM